MKHALAFALLMAAGPAFAGEPVPLFDGKTLAGWEGDAKTWRVEDGAIVGGSLDTTVARNEFLCTTKTYQDFELRLKFKLVGDRAKANAGVQVRTQRIPNHHEVSGYQADIGQDYWGALYDESRRKKVLAGPPKEDIPKLARFDDWNDYVIRCEGPRIQLWLNGTKTVDYVEKEAGIERSGVIGLQIHGGAKAKAYYKDIRIEELAASSRANWPAWRGPNADGVADASANPPITWDGPSGKNVKWKLPLPGKGSSTPIVWGDRVFVLSAVKTDREATAAERPKVDPRIEKKTDPPTHFYRFLVTCVDRTSGQKLWEHVAAEKVPHEGHHPSHSYCAGSPATDGERLYCCFGSFGLYCYDLDGKALWSRDLGRMSTRLGWGEAVTPVVHRGSLILNWDQEAGSALYCLDAKTGETRWQTRRTERTTWNTPLVTEFGGVTQVILNGTRHVNSYDLSDGRELWSAPGTTVNPIPSPLRFGDTVICTGGYQGVVAFAVPLRSAGTVDGSGLTWKYAKGTPYVPSPVPVGDRLYFTEGNKTGLTVLDAKTGKAVIDREPLPGTTGFYASPILAGGRVYFVDRMGTAVVLKPGSSLEVLATNKLGDPVDASPVPVGTSLLLRGEKYLWCLEQN